MTLANVLAVANIAHGVGALLGASVAWTMIGNAKRERGDAEAQRTGVERLSNVTAHFTSSLATRGTPPHARRLRQCVPAGATIALVLAAVLARPFVNLAAHRGEQEASLGYDALIAERDAEALRWSRAATRMNPNIASWWFNRAVAEDRLGRLDAALASYNNAARLAPGNRDYRAARDRMHDYLAGATATADAR
jgi:Flp pilus assembly protein TadD